MAIRAVQVVAKTLMSEEAETVMKSAARMIRTTAVEEGGVVVENTMAESVTVQTMSRLGGEAESGLGRIGETLARAPKQAEIDFGKAREFKEINLNTPKEIDLPNPKGIDVEPGKINVAEEVTKNVPSDPEGLIQAVEQGKHQGGNQEPGEKRPTVEIANKTDKKNELENSDDGKRQVEVGKSKEGPEVGRNLHAEMVE